MSRNFSLNNILDNCEINDNNNENLYSNIIFTDGACTLKDKNGLRQAGFGIYIEEKTNISFLKNFKLSKKFNTNIFNINNQTLSLNNPNQILNLEVTNIRAEGYAILYVLIIFKIILIDKVNLDNSNDIINYLNDYNIFPHHDFKKHINICKKCISKDILIVTDSEFWIKVITIWSINWFNKDIIMDKKNPDLILYIMYYYYLLLQNNINIDFQHVKSHADKKKKDFYNYYEFGNIEADKLALIAKNSNNFNFNLL